LICRSNNVEKREDNSGISGDPLQDSRVIKEAARLQDIYFEKHLRGEKKLYPGFFHFPDGGNRI
jgi:hypothetical protein